MKKRDSFIIGLIIIGCVVLGVVCSFLISSITTKPEATTKIIASPGGEYVRGVATFISDDLDFTLLETDNQYQWEIFFESETGDMVFLTTPVNMTEIEVLRFKPNGEVYLYGELVTRDEGIVKTVGEWFSEVLGYLKEDNE